MQVTRREINLRILCHLNLHTGKEGQLMRDRVRIDANGGNNLGNPLQYHCTKFFAGWLQKVLQEE